MFEIHALTQRHIRKFIRDKAAVFTSLLTVIILLALYFLFIGKQYVGGLEGLDEALRIQLLIGVMMGGILVINTLSLSLGVMGNLVTDIDQKKMEGFLVTPVRRYKIILSYYLSAIIVTSILTLLMWFLTVLYAGLFSSYWYDLIIIIKVSGLIILFTFISTAIMVFMTSLVKSVNAFGTLSGVLGTFVGFMSGIYMPLVQMGDNIVKIASLNPYTHMSILMKKVLLEQPLANLLTLLQSNPNIPNPANEVESIRNIYGASEIGIFGQSVSLGWIGVFVAILTLVFLYFSYRNMSRRITR
jgi:multidrug/hemolysin transport system permease protein